MVSTKVSEVYFVRKLRPVLIAFVIITAVVIVPIATAHSLTSATKFTFYPFAAIASLLIIFIVIVTIYFGIKILRTMKKIFDLTQERQIHSFVQKVSSY